MYTAATTVAHSTTAAPNNTGALNAPAAPSIRTPMTTVHTVSSAPPSNRCPAATPALGNSKAPNPIAVTQTKATAIGGSAHAIIAQPLSRRPARIHSHVLTEQLAAALRRYSSRLTPPPTPAISVVIHLVVLAGWVALFLNAFGRGGLFAWSVGLAYLGYDAVLVAFTAWHIRGLTAVVDPRHGAPANLSLAVLVAVHNEAAVLPATVAALLGQDDPPDEIVIADDGSTDDTADILDVHFGVPAPNVGARKTVVHGPTSITLLRLPHGGKARALNAAITATDADIVLTVDGDTLVDPPAIGVVRQAFSHEPELVGVTGIITPVVPADAHRRAWQFFQTYEYIRNFLGRYAWMRVDCLQLISGAFAGFRRAPVVDVGGSDEVSMVEDYELVHPLRRYAGERGLGWRFEVLGAAQARTEAPGWRPPSFGTATLVRGFPADPVVVLRDDRRPPDGEVGHRDAAGQSRRHRGAGIRTRGVRPAGRLRGDQGHLYLGLVLLVVAGKLVLDVVFGLWAMRRYRSWVSDPARGSLIGITMMTIIEPLTFRLMLQCAGRCWGGSHFSPVGSSGGVNSGSG